MFICFECPQTLQRKEAELLLSQMRGTHHRRCSKADKRRTVKTSKWKVCQTFSNSPVWQNAPVKVEGHVQVKPATWSMHSPPFRQGPDSHSFMSAKWIEHNYWEMNSEGIVWTLHGMSRIVLLCEMAYTCVKAEFQIVDRCLAPTVLFHPYVAKWFEIFHQPSWEKKIRKKTSSYCG